MERLISLAGEGKLKPVIDRELPLEQAADAHRADPSAGDLREGHPATLGGVGFRNSVSLPELVHQTRSAADSASPGYQGLISRDGLWAGPRTDRARLTSTPRI
jgi:Zinc-binding dehydrogenase